MKNDAMSRGAQSVIERRNSDSNADSALWETLRNERKRMEQIKQKCQSQVEEAGYFVLVSEHNPAAIQLKYPKSITEYNPDTIKSEKEVGGNHEKNRVIWSYPIGTIWGDESGNKSNTYEPYAEEQILFSIGSFIEENKTKLRDNNSRVAKFLYEKNFVIAKKFLILVVMIAIFIYIFFKI